MKTERPLWMRGQMIAPQHFQQQAATTAWSIESVARIGALNPWGVQQALFDNALLKQGKLRASHLCVRFADGTLTDSGNADPLPPAMTLPQANELTVVLALALEYDNGGNCLQPDEKAERPVRWRQAWRLVRNHFGDDARQIAVMQPELTLRDSQQDNGNYQTVPVARLYRDSQGNWLQDSTFIPPLLSVQASPWLIGQLTQLTKQLQTRLKRLMAMRRESNERMADFAVADVSLFWLLNALNSAEPVLGHFQHHPQVHPERLYQVLAELAGSLLTFSLSHSTEDIPAYHHENLTATFIPLFELLEVLLEASLPSRVVAVELDHDDRRKRWHARLNDPRLREEADFYLSVRSSLPASQLLEMFPIQCRTGCPAEVDRIVNSSEPGVPLRAMTHVPAAVPLRLENHYFTLDMTHPAAQTMLAEGHCVFYVPGGLGDPELELFAVLRS